MTTAQQRTPNPVKLLLSDSNHSCVQRCSGRVWAVTVQEALRKGAPQAGVA